MNILHRARLFQAFALSLMVGTIALAAEEPVTALGGLDPVMLIQGTEVKGKAAWQVTQGRYRYLFADEASQRKFQAAPDRYRVQFDGFCMKMGPLSGRGSPERWLLSEGRLYLFASDSCRDSFKSDPAAYTDRADAPPTGRAADQKRGRELIELALAGFGGADKVDALKNIRWETITIYEQEGKKTEMRQATTVVLPDHLRLDYSYGDFRDGHELANGRLVEVSAENELTPMPAEVYEFVRRRLYREPLALLRARNQPEFVAFAAGSGEVGGQPVEWLNLGYAGATTKLAIDPNTGRVLAAVYRGRSPSKLGEICRAYSDFKNIEGGLTLPQQWEVTYEGKPPPGPKPASRSVSLNVPLDAR
jgi:YHS domain-containing protein